MEYNVKITPTRMVFNKGDYFIFSCKVIEGNIPKDPKWRNISITGEIGYMDIGKEYDMVLGATQRAYSYEVVANIIDIDFNNKESVKSYMESQITKKRTETILEVYPDFLETVIEVNKNDDIKIQNVIDVNKLKGIGETTLVKIYEKLANNIGTILTTQVITECGFKFTPKITTMLSKKYKDMDSLKEMLTNNPYKTLLRLNKVGFEKVDNMILASKEELRVSDIRCVSIVDYILMKNENVDRNTCIHYDVLLSEVGSKYKEIKELTKVNLDKMIEQGSVIKRDGYVATRDTYTKEFCIADNIRQLLLRDGKWDINWKKYIGLGDFELSEQQQGLLETVCNNNFVVLNGYAGTGKSASVTALCNLLDDCGKEYRMCTPTGKSADVLAKYTGREVTTIHKLFKIKNDGESKETVDGIDVLIIDEFSMVDVGLMYTVMKGINLNHTKIVLIGDFEQLASVGYGNIATDISNAEGVPLVTLDKVFRYSDGGLMRVATECRNGNMYLNGKQPQEVFGINKDYVFYNKKSSRKTVKDTPHNIEMLITIYGKALKQGITIDELQVLCATRKNYFGTESINKIIQKEFNSNPTVNVGSMELKLGDRVMQTVNNYKTSDIDGANAPVYNGNTGKVINISSTNVRVDFGDKIIDYDEELVEELELAYAITFHKSQGSSAKYIIMVTPSMHEFMLNKQLLYVGMTRATHKVFHIGEPKVIEQALKKDETTTRITMLSSLLKLMLNK